MAIFSHISVKYFSNILFMRRLILCMLSLSYLFGFVLGFILCDLIPSIQDVELEDHSIIDQLFIMKPMDRFLFIAKNNILVGCKCFFGGLFTLGLYSVISNMYSAFVFGVVLEKSTAVLSIGEILRTTLPHCFEIVGIIGMGYTGAILGISLLSRKYYLSFVGILLLFTVSLLLILVSAVIENYISIY